MRRKRSALNSERPTRQDVAAAYGKTILDVIGPGLQVLFCGINPSLYSAAVGRHFARPGNRFWPTLHAAGFTGRVMHPTEQDELIGLGLGTSLTAVFTDHVYRNPQAVGWSITSVMAPAGVLSVLLFWRALAALKRHRPA